MSKWIKSGMAVVHVTNLDKVLTVEKIVFKSKNIILDNGETMRINRIVGVECKYIDDSGNVIRHIVHSKELVPLSVSTKGLTDVYRFINREGDYEHY